MAGYINKKSLSEVEQLRYELAKDEIGIAKLKKYTKPKGDVPTKEVKHY